MSRCWCAAREVEVTAAGQVLMEEGRRLQQQLRHAVQAARRAHSGPRTALRISARGCEVADAEALTRHYNTPHQAFRGPQHRAAGLQMPVEVVVAHWSRQSEDLREGSAELALVRGPFDERDLDSDLLALEQRVALLPASHPLAERDVVTRWDLAADPVLLWAGSQADERAYWLGLTPQHREAVEGPDVDDLLQLLARVRLEQGIAFVPVSLLRLYALPPEVRAVTVEDLPDAEVRLAWAQGQTSPAVASFARHAADHSHEVLSGPPV